MLNKQTAMERARAMRESRIEKGKYLGGNGARTEVIYEAQIALDADALLAVQAETLGEAAKAACHFCSEGRTLVKTGDVWEHPEIKYLNGATLVCLASRIRRLKETPQATPSGDPQ